MYWYFFRNFHMARIPISKDIASDTAHAAHNPSAPKNLDKRSIQTERIRNVRIPDNDADTVPLEKAVNKPEAKILNPTNRHAGTEKYRHRHASWKNGAESPAG